MNQKYPFINFDFAVLWCLFVHQSFVQRLARILVVWVRCLFSLGLPTVSLTVHTLSFSIKHGDAAIPMYKSLLRLNRSKPTCF